MSFGVATLALLIEAALGYPGRLFRFVGHPVTWMGWIIGVLDRSLNREGEAGETRRLKGGVALALLLAVVVVPALIVERFLLAWPFGDLAVALVASSLLAQRSLDAHVRAVATGLARDLEEGRRAVADIVGRDPEALDEAGVARAAIESLAENFSDGVVAPGLWLGIAGLGGGVAYKAINTADSMIGHRTRRYIDFGMVAARTDDVVNLPASRLAGGLIVMASALVPGASAAGAWRAMLRDAPRHRSPNAGWPEAAMAGALGIALAGPRSYGGRVVDDHWMGQGGRRELGADDIKRALRLFRVADGLFIGTLLLATILFL